MRQAPAYLQELRKEHRNHRPQVVRIQAWWRMLLTRARLRPAWQSHWARKLVYSEIEDKVVRFVMAPDLIMDILHFNQWNKDIPLRSEAYYADQRLAQARVDRFVEQQAREVVSQALQDMSRHILKKAGRLDATVLHPLSTQEGLMLDILIGKQCREIARERRDPPQPTTCAHFRTDGHWLVPGICRRANTARHGGGTGTRKRQEVRTQGGERAGRRGGAAAARAQAGAGTGGPTAAEGADRATAAGGGGVACVMDHLASGALSLSLPSSPGTPSPMLANSCLTISSYSFSNLLSSSFFSSLRSSFSPPRSPSFCFICLLKSSVRISKRLAKYFTRSISRFQNSRMVCSSSPICLLRVKDSSSMCSTPSSSPTAMRLLEQGWNLIEDRPIVEAWYWMVHLWLWSRKSQMSRLPSDRPIKITPGLVLLQHPQVMQADFAISMLWKKGTSTPCFHTEKLQSCTVRIMSSQNGLTSSAITGRKERSLSQQNSRLSDLPSSPGFIVQSTTNTSPWSDPPVNVGVFCFFRNWNIAQPRLDTPSGLVIWTPKPAFHTSPVQSVIIFLEESINFLSQNNNCPSLPTDTNCVTSAPGATVGKLYRFFLSNSTPSGIQWMLITGVL